MTTQHAIELSPYSGAVGATVAGVRLAELEAGSPIATELNQALWQHSLLVLPGQNLSPAELVAATRLFGEPMVHPLVPHHPDHPEVIVIDSTQRKNRGRTDFWHADATFSAAPPASPCCNRR